MGDKYIKSPTASDLTTNNRILTDPEKKLFLTTDGADIQLLIRNQFVYITNTVISNLYLPPVAEAEGLSYYIWIANDSNDLVVKEFVSGVGGDSTNWGGDYTLYNAEDNITLFSDGKSWIVTSNNIG
jgi:hypothetical protein